MLCDVIEVATIGNEGVAGHSVALHVLTLGNRVGAHHVGCMASCKPGRAGHPTPSNPLRSSPP